MESPTKARTIRRFLKDPSINVLSSQGHVRDLPEKEFGVDVQNNFQPHYVIIPGKKKIVHQLKQAVRQAQQVLFATDEDREGEAIAWHLAILLGIPPQHAQRAVFHEITKKAVTQAIRQPRPLNMALVWAQQARRILDRLVGYELSPLLWRKIRGFRALSAGRVQSVAVRLVVDREREIEQTPRKTYFTLRAHWLPQHPTDPNIPQLPTRYSEHLPSSQEVHNLITILAKHGATVQNLEETEEKRYPPPPFTTSTLQQEAHRLLHFPVNKTMRLAQELYESGYITYMRTDSVSLAEEAIHQAAQLIRQRFGNEYAHPRQYHSRVRNAQEAHEAIRPTDFSRESVPLSHDANQLYQLIWRRALASQMAPARFLKIQCTITVPHNAISGTFSGGLRTPLFDGFLKLYQDETTTQESHTEPTTNLNPDTLRKYFQPGTPLQLTYAQGTQRWQRPPARYTEATLVKELEKRGIGRPSTYAPTIATILKRGYVEIRNIPGEQRPVQIITWNHGQFSTETRTETIGAERQRLVPTTLGFLITDFLTKHFPEILDYEFTAQMEENLDEIARGTLAWQDFLRKFYSWFHPKVELALQQKHERYERQLGTLPDGRTVLARLTPYGPALEIRPPQGKPHFISLPPTYRLDSITWEQAQQLLTLPKKLGQYQGQDVILRLTRYGFAIQWGNRWISLRNHTQPWTLTLQDILPLLQQHQNQPEERILRTWKTPPIIRIIESNGQRYIAQGKKRVPLPSDIPLSKITRAYCEQLLRNWKPHTHQSPTS